MAWHDAGHGTREVTPEDRRRAVIADLLRSKSTVTITPGMRRHFQQTGRRRRRWWARIMDWRR
jgi:hypothetical protein